MAFLFFSALAWLALETVFLLFWIVRLRTFNKPNSREISKEDSAENWKQFLTLAGVMDIEEFLCGWFHGAPVESIKRGNVEDLIAYGFFNKSRSGMTTTELSQLGSMRKHVEHAFNIRLQSGHNANITFMAHAWEPLKVVHKPLIFYLASHSTALLADLLLSCLGFKRCLTRGLSCWVREPSIACVLAHQRGLLGSVLRTFSSAVLGIHSSWVVFKQYVYQQLMDGVAAYQISVVTYVAGLHGLKQHLSGRDTADRFQQEQQFWEVDSEDSIDSSYDSSHQSHPSYNAHNHRHVQSSGKQFDGTRVAGVGGAKGNGNYKANSKKTNKSKQNEKSSNVNSNNGIKSNRRNANDKEQRKQQNESVTSELPLVFVHGVGLGIAPYIHVLRQILTQSPNRPMLLIDVPCVALKLGMAARGFDEIADTIACAARAQGWSQVSVLSHSYGTFVTSVLTKRHPSLVRGVCLVDPVCLLTCYPQLLQNFIYQKLFRPDTSLASFVKDGARLFVARDYLVAHTFCRKLLWLEVQLWPAQFPDRAVVVLSALDPLVPHDLAVKHLQQITHKKHVQVISNMRHSHGSFLMDPQAINDMICAMDTHLWSDHAPAATPA